MRSYPDPFYPVVDSLAWITRLTRAGAGTVQIRAKDLDHAAALALVRDALAVTAGTPTQLVVNDYWQAAIEAGASHVHLGQEDLVDAEEAGYPWYRRTMPLAAIALVMVIALNFAF